MTDRSSDIHSDIRSDSDNIDIGPDVDGSAGALTPPATSPPPTPLPAPAPADAITLSYGPRDDPFQATLTVSDRGAAMSIPLTPSVLADLLADLHTVDRDQRDQLGLPPSRYLDGDAGAADDGTADDATADDATADDATVVDSVSARRGLRRAADPLGLRQLRDRPRSTLVLAALIAAALFIALLVQVIQR